MRRVLCIDDDQDILDTLNIILATEGYSVRVSTSPGTIFQLVQEFSPDLILMDINMPNFNGLEICKALKAYISTENTPVIMVSSDESIEKAISDFGAQDIIRKPFSIDQIVEIVKLYLDPKVVSLFPDNTDLKEVN
ncbi:PleD family two-component system response regulator [Paradesertivirga mongoliensis]|uniref:PleD family two-component system response regulator n=1 Tax=Paradesertivirga mongoliensis TaxID=2100740 RepID=A0ABW4ZQV7_9SPHI|nr:response regulator [Pedobacter mongoliensis]